MEVVRSEACMSLPSISGSCGTVVTWPSHEPVRAFNVSNDFCASDFVSDWAKTLAAIRTTKTEVAMCDFMVQLSFSFCYKCGNVMGCGNRHKPIRYLVL